MGRAYYCCRYMSLDTGMSSGHPAMRLLELLQLASRFFKKKSRIIIYVHVGAKRACCTRSGGARRLHARRPFVGFGAAFIQARRRLSRFQLWCLHEDCRPHGCTIVDLSYDDPHKAGRCSRCKKRTSIVHKANIPTELPVPLCVAVCLLLRTDSKVCHSIVATLDQ